MNAYKTELKWALIFSAVTLLWMVLERLTGLHGEHIAQHATYTNFFAIPAILVFVFALLDKRNSDYAGVISYKQALISGLIISGMVMVLTPLTQLITTYVISPGFFPRVIAYSVQEGLMSQEAAEAYFSVGNYIKWGMVAACMNGIITSAVVSFFVKKSAAS